MGKTQHTVSTTMIVLVFAAFVSIGLPDALFGTAWPDMRVEFDMPNSAVGLLNIPGALAYMVSSAMLGTVMHRLGIARLLIGSTALVGLGLTLYALAPTFWAIVPAVILMAIGSGAIDAALNLFAAQRLPQRYVSWLHGFYGVGALVGPFVMAVFFGFGQSWRWGYAAIAAVLWSMALVFLITRKEWVANTDESTEESHTPVSGKIVLAMPRVQLSLVMVMGGAIVESLASLWIASILVQRFEISRTWGAVGMGVYWAGLTLARMVVPVVWPHASAISIQRWSTFIVLIATVLMIPASLPLTWLGIVLVGVGVASIFPSAITVTSDRFGPAVSTHAVGYVVSASTLMFAVMPALSGWLADAAGFVIIPCLMVVGAMLLLLTQVRLVSGDTLSPISE